MEWKHLLAPPPTFIMKSVLRRRLASVTPTLRGAVLDAGCGSQPYRSAIACDMYVPLDWPARQPAVGGDVAHLPFAAEAFDGVLCTEVIEHVPFPDAVFCEFERVLRPGGAACITTPMYWPLHHEPYDFFRFTRHGLARLAASAGLHTVRVERIGGQATLVGVLLADVLFRLATKILWFLPRGARVAIAAALLLPWSLTVYAAGRMLDRLENKHALGWMMVVRKPEQARSS